MISTSHNFIYLHVPKTGGNSLQTALLPFSDDRKVLSSKQDGHDRFGLRGPVTTRKHARLNEYQAKLPGSSVTHQIMISVRHPFERAISSYFSPHRHIKADGTPSVIHWSEDDFIDQLSLPSQEAATSFLRIGEHVIQPDLVLRFETLQQDFNSAIAFLGLPPIASLPHVNRTVREASLRAGILSSRTLRDIVEAFYKDDMDFFDYQPYVAAT